MKRVGPGRGTMAVSVAVWLFFVLCVVYGVWALATDNWRASPETLTAIGVAPGREKWSMLLGVPLFAAIAVFFAYRIFYLGGGYVLYNEEMVVVVLNRKDRRSCRWQDLRSFGVTVRSLGEIEPPLPPPLLGFFFQFPDGRRFPVRAMFRGYKELKALLVRKGFLPRGDGRP